MRKTAEIIFASIILLSSCVAEVGGFQHSGAGRQSEAEHLSSIPLQAVPVYNMLKATEASDARLFKSVWYSGTLKLWAAWGVKDYGAAVREWRKFWREELGRYDPGDLRYRYEGDESRGVVHIIYKGKEHDGLYVIREDGVWKLRGGG